jgi:predicted DNA binding CopG/RHH family protein
MKKQIPKFKSEEEEREFWATHDSIDYVDWNKANRIHFANLKPSTRTISLRLPTGLLARIKEEANKRDMPYQSLIKSSLYEVFQKLNEQTGRAAKGVVELNVKQPARPKFSQPTRAKSKLQLP